jgi:hypothetical protein
MAASLLVCLRLAMRSRATPTAMSGVGMPVRHPAWVGIKFQPVPPAEPSAACQQCQRGDEYDHRDQDPEPVELSVEQGPGGFLPEIDQQEVDQQQPELVPEELAGVD